MLVTNTQKVVEITDTAKLEFYRLIGEGYKAMEVELAEEMKHTSEPLCIRRFSFGHRHSGKRRILVDTNVILADHSIPNHPIKKNHPVKKKYLTAPPFSCNMYRVRNLTWKKLWNRVCCTTFMESC